MLPESIFNAVDLMSTRIFLYRMFHIKAIVSLPRNVFIDTPTLTSLLFAQKKEQAEIIAWDGEWSKHLQFAETAVKTAKTLVSKKILANYATANEVSDAVMKVLEGIISPEEWAYKKGKNAEVLPLDIRSRSMSVEEAGSHYNSFLKSAFVNRFLNRYAFKNTAVNFDQVYRAYIVDEVGFKLSKRKEKSRPNQLFRLQTKNFMEIQNLHLCDEECSVLTDTHNPQKVLDFIKRDVAWRSNV